MNGENETLLQQGIGEVRAGNKREGARLLAQVVKTEPQSEEAWFWLAAATDQPSEATACLRRVLAINPNNTRASQALEMLGQSAGGLERGLNMGSEMSSSAATYSPGRGLNTGELLGYGGGGAATIAPPPPSPSFSSAPAPFSENELMGIGATSAPPPSRPSDLFGNTGTLNEAPPVPPPPFGQPSWAASNESSAPPRPPLPNFNSDPYTGQPTPGFQGGGGGVRLGQLDPELAAQQAAQAAQVAAIPTYYDAGAEMRAGLLDDSVRSQSQTQTAAKPGRTAKAPKPKKIKLAPPPVTKGRRRTNPLSLILLVLLVLVLIGALVFQFVIRPNLNNTTTVVADNTPAATTTDVAATGTTNATITSGVAGTAGAATTVAQPVTTAAVTTALATTVAASTTTVPATTTTASTIAATPVSTNVSGVAGTGQTSATTLPAITIPPLQNGKPPADVLQYISDSKGLMDKLQTYQDLLINKVAVPYRRGDIPAQADLNKLLRTDISVVEMGQYANRLKTQFVPLGGYYLSQISNEYADDISNAARAWDAFFDSGKLTELDNVSRFAEKAQKDRIRWVAALAKPYPYK